MPSAIQSSPSAPWMPVTVWVSSSEAYAELQCDDDEPAVNEAFLAALKDRQSEIERQFGEPLRAQFVESLQARAAAVLLTRELAPFRIDVTQTIA